MKFKLLLSLLVAGTLAAGAQNQSFQDGIDYYKAGQPSNAKTILNNNLTGLTPNQKAVAYYYLGQIALKEKDNATARRYFDDGIAADVECPYNYVGLGKLALFQGNKSEADNQFKLAQKFGKKNHEITVDIARAFYQADPVKYANDVTKYLEKAKKESKFQEPSIYILEGDMNYDKGEYGQAATSYEQAIEADKTDPAGYVNYAHAYTYVNPEFAIRKLREYLQLNPESALAQRELAEKLYTANYWDKAAEQYGKYIQNRNHFPEDEARYAVLLYFGKNYNKSIEVADNLLEKQPNFMVERVRMLDYNMLGDYANAVEKGKQFFNNYPGGNYNANDYIAYSDALSKTGADSTAVEYMTVATEKFPDNPKVFEMYSAMLSRVDQHAKAADAYAKFLELNPEVEVGDLFTGAGRYLNVASTTVDSDPAAAREAALKGITLMNTCIERAQPVPALYQRLARLQRMANGDKPDQASTESYLKMIELLDSDPANLTKKSAIDQYRDGYLWLNKYYLSQGDNEKAGEAANQFNHYTELRNTVQ